MSTIKDKRIDVGRLELCQRINHPRAPKEAYADRRRGWVIQVWDYGDDGSLRVSIKHTRAKSRQQAQERGYALPITWDDMQAIKDHFWPDRIGIEIFPRKDNVVNVADMRWMWIIPEGASLPYDLANMGGH